MPNIEQQAVLSGQILGNAATKLCYKEKTVFMKELDTQNLWNIKIGSQEGDNVLFWIFVGFQQKN